MSEWKKVIVSGSDAALASLKVDAAVVAATLTGSLQGNVVGNLTGTASNATSASYAVSASEAAHAVSASYAVSASEAAHAVLADDATTLQTARNFSISGGGITATAKSFDGSADVVLTASIDAGAVGSTELAADAVTLGKIADSAFAVSASGDVSGNAALLGDVVSIDLQLGTGVVGTTELAADAVTNAKLADNAVQTENILNGAVTNDKLDNDSVFVGNTELVLGDTITTIDGLTLTDAVATGSFTGSFVGDGSGLTGVSASVLLNSVSNGDGIESFSFNGSGAATVTLDTASAHFTDGVRGKIAVADTTGAAGIDLSYNATTGTISGSLVNSKVTVGTTPINLGDTANSLAGLSTVEATEFIGDLTGNADTATSASYASVATSASYAAVATSASYAAMATSASYAAVATSASYAAMATSASEAAHAVSASQAVSADHADAAGMVDFELKNGDGIESLVYDGSSVQFITLDTASAHFVGGVKTKMNTDAVVSGSFSSPNQGVLAAGSEGNIDLGLETTDSVAFANIAIAGSGSFGGSLVVQGDLTVNGTASYINTQELLVEDKFVIFASGSTTATDGGFIVSQAAGNIGQAFAYQAASGRWGVEAGVAYDATSITPEAYVSLVATSNTDVAYQKNGNLFVQDGEIFIWA